MRATVGITLFVLFLSFALTSAINIPSLPSPCSKGKEFHFCGSSCPETCQSLRKKEHDSNVFNGQDDKATTDRGMICHFCMPGCQCKKGTVEDKVSKLCVKPEMCPRNNGF